MGAWADIPGGPLPSQELLDKGLTDAKAGGNGALGAEPLITGAENLLSQVKGVGFHAYEHIRRPPYIQSRTAVYARLPNRPTDVVLLRLEAEADEMWSFVQQKANKQWMWIAMDAKTRQVIAFHVGDRRRDSAKELWAKIPLGYCEQATFHTDQYEAYQGVIPAVRHKAITKKAR
jgi:IS1 family transposase